MNEDMAFQIGMVLGIIIGATCGSMLLGLYNEIKEKRKKK